jgi:hypothetical protein
LSSAPPAYWMRNNTNNACTLTRFLHPRSATLFTEIHRSRVLPSRVMLRHRTYHVPRRLTLSVNSLVSFQPSALTGCMPFRALPSRDRLASRRNIPSCDWLSDRLSRHKPTPSICFDTRLRLAVTKTWLIEQTYLRNICPSQVPGVLALLAQRHSCKSGLASGISSLCWLERAVGKISPPCGRPGSLGIHPPWGIPLPSLGLSGHAVLALTSLT